MKNAKRVLGWGIVIMVLFISVLLLGDLLITNYKEAVKDSTPLKVMNFHGQIWRGRVCSEFIRVVDGFATVLVRSPNDEKNIERTFLPFMVHIPTFANVPGHERALEYKFGEEIFFVVVGNPSGTSRDNPDTLIGLTLSPIPSSLGEEIPLGLVDRSRVVNPKQ